MGLTANQRLCKQPSEKRKFEMSFASVLGSSENITAITSVASEKVGGYTSDLSIGSTGLVSATPTGTVEMYIEDLQKILATLKQSKKMLNKDSKLMRTFYKQVKEDYDNLMF